MGIEREQGILREHGVVRLGLRGDLAPQGLEGRGRLRIEHLRVGAHEVRAAGEVLVDLLAERLAQERHDAVAHPGAQERVVGVHRVLPPLDVVEAADLLGVASTQRARLVAAGAQEGAQPGAARRGDAGQGAGTGPAGQRHEHLLGLVVEGVAQQDREGTAVLADLLEQGAARVPGRVLEASGAVGADLRSPHVGALGAEALARGGRPLGDLGGAVLEAVVDDHGLSLEPHPGPDPGGRGQQREGVGPAAHAHDEPGRHARGVGAVGEVLEARGERGADGGAGARDDGGRSGHQRPETISVAIASTAAFASTPEDGSKEWTTIENATGRPSGRAAMPTRVEVPPR